MASPDNTDAADLSTWLTVVFGGYVGARDLGKIFHSRVAYRIGPKRGPEPDIGLYPRNWRRLAAAATSMVRLGWRSRLSVQTAWLVITCKNERS